MSALQTHLRTGGTLEALAALGIKVKVHPSHPELHLFTYDQIESPKAHPIVTASRGTILDASKDWAFVCRPFDRFFNHGEGPAAPLDWNTARAYKKEDGSLCNLYFHQGQWHVATRGLPDAGGTLPYKPMSAPEMTFADLFWLVMCSTDSFGAESLEGHEDLTFMFELCSPHNRVVVRYPETRLILIGVRAIDTGIEHNVADYIHLFPTAQLVQHWDLSDLDAVTATFRDLNPLDHEGYVVCDAKYNRIKVKHPGYLALHHLKGEGASPKRFVELIRTGEHGEFIANFPEYETDFNEVKDRFEGLVAHLEAVYAAARGIETQKDFALAITKEHKCRMPGTLFEFRKAEKKGEVATIRQLLAAANMNGLLLSLGYKES